jgi:hypothetical protein
MLQWPIQSAESIFIRSDHSSSRQVGSATTRNGSPNVSYDCCGLASDISGAVVTWITDVVGKPPSYLSWWLARWLN